MTSALPAPCTLVLCLLCCGAQAAATDVMSEQEFLGDIPVVLSASRLTQAVSEAPMAVTIIDRDTIKASGFRQIADLMRLVPGMYVGYFKGDQPVVSYHGLSDAFSRRMQVLVDGRSVYMPTLGGVEWTELPLSVDDIERIEVIRGPDAATYGSNSFLAVINIITVAPVQSAGTSSYVGSGEAGTREAAVRHGGALDDIAYQVSAGYRGDHGFGQGNDGQRAMYANASADFHPVPSDSLHLTLGGTQSQANGSLIPCEAACTDNLAVHSNFEQLRWTRQLADSDELSVQLFHDVYRAQERAYDWIPVPQPDGSLPRFEFNSPVRTERFDVELQRSHTSSPTVRWVWGANARHEALYAPLFFNSGETLGSHLLRAFAHAEWRVLPDTLIQGGAMLEDTSIAGSDFSPNFAANIHLTPRQTLRASISQATRTPLMYEDFGHNVMTYGAYAVPNVVALGHLVPERILSRELGYLYALPGQAFSLDVKVFSDRLSDLIDTYRYAYPANPNDGRTSTYANLVHADQQGVESGIEWRSGEGTRLNLNLAHIHIRSPSAGYTRSMPANTVSALLSQRLPGNLDGSLGYYQMSSLQMLQVFEAADPVALMRRLDARLAWHFGTAGQDCELALSAQNVLSGYQDFFQYNVFRRRLLLSLSTRL